MSGSDRERSNSITKNNSNGTTKKEGGSKVKQFMSMRFGKGKKIDLEELANGEQIKSKDDNHISSQELDAQFADSLGKTNWKRTKVTDLFVDMNETAPGKELDLKDNKEKQFETWAKAIESLNNVSNPVPNHSTSRLSLQVTETPPKKSKYEKEKEEKEKKKREKKRREEEKEKEKSGKKKIPKDSIRLKGSVRGVGLLKALSSPKNDKDSSDSDNEINERILAIQEREAELEKREKVLEKQSEKLDKLDKLKMLLSFSHFQKSLFTLII